MPRRRKRSQDKSNSIPGRSRGPNDPPSPSNSSTSDAEFLGLEVGGAKVADGGHPSSIVTHRAENLGVEAERTQAAGGRERIIAVAAAVTAVVAVATAITTSLELRQREDHHERDYAQRDSIQVRTTAPVQLGNVSSYIPLIARDSADAQYLATRIVKETASEEVVKIIEEYDTSRGFQHLERVPLPIDPAAEDSTLHQLQREMKAQPVVRVSVTDMGSPQKIMGLHIIPLPRDIRGEKKDSAVISSAGRQNAVAGGGGGGGGGIGGLVRGSDEPITVLVPVGVISDAVKSESSNPKSLSANWY